MNGAQVLLKALEDAGVDTIFGYPGGAIMPVYDALVDSPITHILCRHEQGAALAADGYARVTGQPGICMATSGPGATNLITGIANAYLDSVPLLAITGQVATPVMGTDAFQEVDIFGITLPVVKHSFILKDADQIQQTVQQALRIAQEGRPGPVLIDLPKDMALADASYQALAAEVPAGEPPNLPPQSLLVAEQLLKSAKKPVAYVGGGVGMARCETNLRHFITRLGLPTVATLKGLGALPSNSPWFLGMLGMHGNPAANFAVQESDLLICIGARFDDRATGKLDGFAPAAKVIHIDIDGAEVSKLRTADACLIGRMRSALEHLSEVGVPDIGPWRDRCLEWVRQHRPRYDYPGDDIYAPHLLRRLSERFGSDTYISCDVGQHQMWVAQHCLFDHPSRHLSSGGLGTMGYGLPAAIGAQLARPEQTVVVVSGDGSIMMNLQEMATLMRYRLPVKIVVLDNAALGMVRQWQELFFDHRYSEVDLSDNPDFARLAESFGLQSKSIQYADEIDAGLAFLESSSGPCLLHVKIDPQANVWPLVPPGCSNDHMMEQPK